MTRSDRVLQPRIDCFAFQRQHAKYALVDTAERLTADKAFEGFDLGDCLCHFGDYLSLVVNGGSGTGISLISVPEMPVWPGVTHYSASESTTRHPRPFICSKYNIERMFRMNSRHSSGFTSVPVAIMSNVTSMRG